MKLGWTLAVAAISAASFADRQISIPVGNQVRYGQVRMDWLQTSGKHQTSAWLDAGVGLYFDAALHMVNPAHGQGLTLDFSYSYLLPITDITPGISFGFQDLFDRTEGRRAAYLAVTYYFANDGDFNAEVPTELTVGFWTRSQPFFYGISLPISTQLRLLAEDDTRSLYAGLEYRPDPGISARLLFKDGAPTFGFRLSRRF